MNILAFDTSLNKTYIALLKDGALDTKILESDDKNYHSAYLIQGLKDIMKKNELEFEALNLIAVNNGPGSFTGIRVGVTVAKTMAKELNKKVIGINSLDILYKTYEDLCPEIVLDARRSQFYTKKEGEISLVPYDEVEINKENIVCDTSSLPHLQKRFENKNIINFENDDVNLSLALVEIAKENMNNDNLMWHNLKPMYIQAPPIHQKVLKK